MRRVRIWRIYDHSKVCHFSNWMSCHTLVLETVKGKNRWGGNMRWVYNSSLKSSKRNIWILKGFELVCVSSSEDRYEVITTYGAKEDILIRERLWSGKKGKNGALVNIYGQSKRSLQRILKNTEREKRS